MKVCGQRRSAYGASGGRKPFINLAETTVKEDEWAKRRIMD